MDTPFVAAVNISYLCGSDVTITSKPTCTCPVDHLVGNGKQCRRNVEAERTGRLEVDHELELSRLHERQIGWPLALENAGGVDAGLTVGIQIELAGRGASSHM